MKLLKILFVLLLVIVVVVFIFLLINDNETIKLVECIDGDTARFIINNKEEKVRFIGIDTPESTNFQEEYGIEASNYTCELLRNAENIYIEYDMNSSVRDKYNRVLGWVFVDGNNISELLLSKGYAEVKYIYDDYKYINNLCEVQKVAYSNKLGIWSIHSYNYADNYCSKYIYK